MYRKMIVVLISVLLLTALVTGCSSTPSPTVTDEPVESPDSQVANPASTYCEEQGYTLELHTGEDGGQHGVCVFPDGSECEEWAFYRGECAPGDDEQSVPVAGWMGYVASLPEGAQFDDALVLAADAGRLGIAGTTLDIEAEIETLRDREEPGKYANFWGTLTCGVTDVEGCQLEVTRILTGAATSEPEPVEGWEGTLMSLPKGAQFDDAFVLAGGFPVRFGIDSAVGVGGELELQSELEALRDTETPVRVWGTLTCGVPDTNACQIQVERLEVGDQVYEVTP
jgi:putative hemolysin